MTNPTFSWLHLTDFHFGLQGQETLWPNLRQPFLDDLEELYESTGPWQAVFFTGDLVQKGRSEEFKEMQKLVLDRLWEKLDELGSGDAVLLAVPGNHDLFRPNPYEDNPAVERMLEKDRFADIAAKFWDNPAGSYRRVVSDAFAAYTDWWKDAPHRPRAVTPGTLPGDFSTTLECGGYSVGIVGLNTAFFQLAGGDYRRKLVWNASQLHAVCGRAADDWVANHSVCLLLTHQGPDWLSPDALRHGQTEIAPAGRFALHLYGHMHEAKIQYTRTGGPNAVRECQSHSLFGMEMRGEPPTTLARNHGYSVGRIEFIDHHASLRLWPRIATDEPAGEGWRYISDATHVRLRGDSGTWAETFPCRRIKKAAADVAANNAKASVPAQTPAIAHSTLPSRRPFFGREKELEAIAKFLMPEYKGWGVVLQGPGGLGKTSLALEAAHLAPAEYFPLKLFITAKLSRLDFEGNHVPQDNRVANYFDMLAEIGMALGIDNIDRVPQDHLADQVRHALAAHRVLLVLDNLEAFTPEERRLIYDLLEILPSGCRAIVTSRRQDETAARTISLDKLDFHSASKLLEKLGERIPALAQLTAEEHQQLYDETGGNPLLLTWVAAQLGRTQDRSRTVADAVLLLKEVCRKHEADEKSDPLEYVFGDLLETFTENETAVLAALCHFSEPAQLSTLLPVTQLNEYAARNALEGLRDQGLLIEDETNLTWFLPPLCSRFLRHRRPDEVGAAGLRLEEQAYDLAVRLGGSRQDGYPELEAAWPLIQAALPLLMEGNNERLQQVCKKMEKFLDFTGRWHRLLTLSQAAETRAVSVGDELNAGWRAYDAGCVHYQQGEANAVFACEKKCIDYWGNATSGRQHAAVCYLRGLGFLLSGNIESAREAIQEGLDQARLDKPDSFTVLTLLIILAGLKMESGSLDDAETDFQQALEMAIGKDRAESAATITTNLADLNLRRRKWPAARDLAQKALALANSLGRLELIAESERILAEASLGQQFLEQALIHARKAVDIYKEFRTNSQSAQRTLAACEAAWTSKGKPAPPSGRSPKK
jgi:tetratricopeptide (TPR) repeat protein/predicted phosphodiesterase